MFPLGTARVDASRWHWATSTKRYRSDTVSAEHHSVLPVIPITVVRLGDEVEDLVLGVLRSGMIAQGPLVQRLEDEFAAMIGVEHVVAVNNGTTALIAALNVLDLQPGDEVVTSPFTFVATLNAIIEAGATARFADIGDGDFNMAPEATEAAITDRTKVLMPVHLYGQCADMDRLAPLADRNGLVVVEDAAQAHGAAIGDRVAGSWGIGCFSLYATKNLTTGEGGLISTGDASLADRLRVLRNQGMRQRYVYEMAGNNYRMTDLQAALVPAAVEWLRRTRCRSAAQRGRCSATGFAGSPACVSRRPCRGATTSGTSTRSWSTARHA